MKRRYILPLSLAVLSSGTIAAWVWLYPPSVIQSGHDPRNPDLIAEFLTLYPKAVVDQMYSTGKYGPPTDRAPTGLHSRYVLDMQVPSRGGAPTVRLAGVTSIRLLPDGRAEIVYGDSWLLTLLQWEQLTRAHGDFDAIGIHLKESQPVQNFDLYWGAA